MQDYSPLKLSAVWTAKTKVAQCGCRVCSYFKDHPIELIQLLQGGLGDLLDYKTYTSHGLWYPVRRTRNVFTTYGLTNLASAVSGANTFPGYLAVESLHTSPSSAVNIGDSVVNLLARVDQAGDTQLTLSFGLTNQEVVTFTAVSGSGPYTYTLSGTAAKAHATTDIVVRTPQSTDTITNVVSEVQFDSVNFSNQRIGSPGGYSTGSFNWTVQFYYPGPTLQTFIALCGMCDTLTLGSGNLHNHFIMNYNNNTGNDLEIDGSLTISNGP